MRSGLYSSLLTLLGAAGLALTQSPVHAGALPQGGSGGGTVVYGSVFDADTAASAQAAPAQAAPAAAPASKPVVISGPVPIEGHGDLTHGPSVITPGYTNDCGLQENRYFAHLDFLLYRLQNTALVPPLVANSPVGVLAVPTTTTTVTGGVVTSTTTQVNNVPVAFAITPGVASSVVNLGDQPGARVTFGYWCDTEHCLGVEASLFALDRKDFDFSTANGSSGAQIFNTSLSNTLITISGASTSTSNTPVMVAANASSHLLGTASSQMWGAELNAIGGNVSIGGLRANWLAGFRYINLQEDITTTEIANVAPVATATATGIVQIPNFTASFFDHVVANNHFIAPQLGVEYDWCLGCGIFFQGFAKVAVGDMHEAFSLVGFTSETVPGGGTTPGGLLVSGSDSGAHREHDRIAAVPELNINFGYQIGPRLRVYVGYDVLYFSTIARMGNQISTATTTANITVGTTTVPFRLAEPAFNPTGSELWVQGFDAGLELRF
jgi:hypothetical protein